MPSQTQQESTVLGAVRALLDATASGNRFADAMASVVAETSSLPLARLDEWERKVRAELWLAARRSPSPSWKFWSSPDRFASWLDLCSGDGFRRERILRSLSDGAPNSFFLVLALRRLNDWVPEVRAAARERLPLLSERSNPEHVVDALWYTFAHWSSWGRLEEVDRQLLVELTSNGQVAPLLKSRIHQASAGPAAYVLTQAGRGPGLDAWLAELARTAVQPSVRAMAYRSLFDERMVWTVGRRWIWTEVQWCKGRFEPVVAERILPRTEGLRQLLGLAMGDRSAQVRRVAAEFVFKHLDLLGPEAHPIALRLASDSNATVAERGRFALKLLDATS
jgi:transposase